MVCVEFDPKNDLAYIYLTKIEPGDVAFSYNCDPSKMSAMINLDFDRAGRLVGIEFVGARGVVPADLLEESHPPGRSPCSSSSAGRTEPQA